MKMRRFFGVLTLVAAVGAAGLLATPAQAASVSVCKITANYAHGSVHVNGTINATGTASCTPRAASVYLKTTLIRQDGVRYPGSPDQRANVSSMSTNAATSCANGKRTFVTLVEYAVTAPPGYSPHYQPGSIKTQPIGPVCSNKGMKTITENDEFDNTWLNTPVPEAETFEIPLEFVPEEAN